MNKLYTPGNADFLFLSQSAADDASSYSQPEARESSSRLSPLTIENSPLTNINQSVSLKAISMNTSKINNMKNNVISKWQGFAGKAVGKVLMGMMLMISANVVLSQTTITASGMTSITCPAVPTVIWTTPPSGTTFSQLSRGSGVTCASSNTGISGSGFNVTLVNAISGSKWYTYSITSNSSTTFTVTALSIQSQVSSASGSPNVSVQYSIGGNAPTNVIGSFVPTASSVNYPFTGLSITVGASQVLNIYVIPTGLTAGTTTARFENSSSVTITTSSASSVADPAAFTQQTSNTTTTQVGLSATANANGNSIITAFNTTNSFGTPANGTSYAANATLPTAGTVTYNGTAAGLALAPHTGRAANTAYFYKTWSYDGATTYSGGVTATGTTQANVSANATPASITAVSALLGGTVDAGGGATLTARGVAVGTSASPTSLNSSGTTTVAFTQTVSGLTPQTLYFSRAYATNAGGTSFATADVSFRTLSSPPTVQPTSVAGTATGVGSFSVTVTGNATYPASGATKAGYLLLYGTTAPSLVASPNGLVPASATSSGTAITVTETAAPTAPNVTGLSATGLLANTTYNILIVPYTWDGTNAATYNYFTTGARTATVTTLPTGYYWNGGNNAANPANGGSGNWSGTNNWRVDYNGAAATWADGNPAVLGGTAGTVTLSSSVAPTATTILSPGYILATSGTSPVTLSNAVALGANGVTTAPISGANLTISGAITGASALTKSGAGTLFLNNSGNTYSTGTTISAGTLSVDGAGRTGTGTITINAGTYQVTVNTSSTQNIVVADAASTIDISNAVSYTAASAAVFSGSGRLNKTGAGSLVFPSANTATHSYSGGLTISAGTVQINKERDLGTVPASATAGNIVLDGGTLASATSVTISSNRGIAVGPATGTGSGTIDVASGTTLTYAGIMANNGGTGNLIKTGAGTLAVSGSSTYTGGITINAGTVAISTTASALGINPSSPNATSVIINGGTLSFPTTLALGVNRGVSLGTSGGTIQVAGTTGTVSGVIGDLSGAGSLTKTGPNTLVLSAANTYTGTTTVSTGVLNLTGSLSSSSAVTVASAATLSGTGNAAGTVSNNGTLSPAGAASIGTLSTGSETWNTGSTYAIDVNNVSGTAGTINDLLAITGSLSTSGAVNIALTGTITGFSYTTAASWIIAATTSGITNNATYSFNTTGITNAIGNGTFSISISGNNLILNFIPGQAAIAFTTTTGSSTGLIGSSSNVIYQANLAVSGNDATFTGVTYTTAGTYTSADIASSGIKLWYSTSSTFSTSTATQIGSSITAAGTGETLAFTSGISQALTAGATYYLYVTVDYTVGATVGRAINITATATTNYSFGATVTRSGTSGVGTTQIITGYTTKVWSGTGTNAAWLTTSNWSPTGAPATTDIAQFAATTSSGNTVGINMNTAGGSQAVGAIEFTSARANTINIGNSSGTNGVLIINGVVLNSQANVIIRNNSTQLLTIKDNVSGTSTMGLGLGNGANNIINIDGTGGVSISSIISGVNPFTLAGVGSGILTLSGNNIYTGATTISSSKLSVASIGNGGVAGNLGQATGAAANLVLDGGTLQYTGVTASTNRSFTLSAGKTSTIEITSSTANLTISGSAASTSGALIKAGAGTLTFSGNNAYTGATTVSAGTLAIQKAGYTSTITTSGILVTFSSAPVAGTFQVLNGPLSSTATLSTSGLGIGQTASFNASTGVLTVFDAPTITFADITKTYGDAAFNLGATSNSGGTITYSTSDATIASLSGANNARVNILKAGTVTITASQAASGNYSAGTKTATLTINSSSIANANFRSGAAGNFSSTATWEYSTDGITWTQASAIPTSNNNVDIFFTVTQDQNFTVGSGKRLQIRTEPPNPGSLIIGPTANLEMTDASCAINFNGRPVTVKSTIDGTGSIGKMLGSLANATNVTVERYIPANGHRAYRLLSVPTSGQTIKESWQENQATGLTGLGTIITSNIAGGGFDAVTPGASMFSYDATGGTNGSGSYVAVANTSTLVSSQPAWLVYIRGDRTALSTNSVLTPTTLRTKGIITSGTVSTTVPAGQYSLTGNPYASAINLLNVNMTGGLAGTVLVVWDPTIGTQGGYVNLTPNGSPVTGYTASPAATGGMLTNSGYTTFNNTIQSGQAFFVQAGSTSGTITINENSKVAGSTNLVFRPSTPSTPTGADQRLFANLYSTTTAGKTLLDGIYISLDEANSNAIDNFDGRKQNNFGENLGMNLQGINLAVEKRKPFVSDDTVFFNTTSLRRTTYQLYFKTENLNPNMVATLEDNYLNTKILVNPNGNSTYDFTVDANAASVAPDRFRVVFKALESGPLPVIFTSIKAAQQNNNIAVSWEVGSQLSVARYEVEKSVDGRNFVKVAGIDAGTATTYNWLDVDVVQGANFYRVRAIDNNATYKYTQIVKITLGTKGAGISVSPNPVKGNIIHLQFANQQAGKYRINLTNAAGQLMYSNILQHAGGSSSQTFTLYSQIISGIYQLEIIEPDKTRRAQKLIIQ